MRVSNNSEAARLYRCAYRMKVGPPINAEVLVPGQVLSAVYFATASRLVTSSGLRGQSFFPFSQQFRHAHKFFGRLCLLCLCFVLSVILIFCSLSLCAGGSFPLPAQTGMRWARTAFYCALRPAFMVLSWFPACMTKFVMYIYTCWLLATPFVCAFVCLCLCSMYSY